MGGDRVCAAAESYIGLVEVGVGVIPAGGGCLFMLERVLDGVDEPILSQIPFIRTAFENIGMAKVATSGEEARDRKFLRPFDKVEINRDQQLWTAKRMAIGAWRTRATTRRCRRPTSCPARKVSRPSK